MSRKDTFEGENLVRGWGNRPAFHLALIALVGLLAYANSFHVPFVLDDYRSIVKNGVIKDLGAFISGAGYAYNPRRFVGYLTVALNYRFGGLHVVGYHAVNLAIHIVSGWLVYAMGTITFRTPFFVNSGTGAAVSDPQQRRFIPLFAALLFIAHPVQTQAVTYVIQRLASLCTLFYLLAVVTYAAARVTGGKGRGRGRTLVLYCLSLAAAVLAMKTKEIAFTLPLTIVLYELLFFRMTAVKRLLFLSPLLLTLALVPLGILGTGRPVGEFLADVAERTRVDSAIPRLDYLFTQFRVMATYLRLLLFPVRQNLDYDYPVFTSLFALPVLLSLLLLLFLFGLAIVLLLRTRPVAGGSGAAAGPELRLVSFGIFWFFLALSVESSIIPIADVIFEHRLYLATPGAFLAVSAAFFTLSGRFSRRGTIVVATAVVSVLAVVTYARNGVWGDAVGLARDTVAKSPDKARPHFNLADVLSRAGWTDEAIREAEIAGRLDPRRAEPPTLLGTLYLSSGRYDRAIWEFSRAVSLEPAYVAARTGLGDAYGRKGMVREALEQYRTALRLSPNDPELCTKAGMVLMATGDPAAAVPLFQQAVHLSPNSKSFRANLARATEAARGRAAP